MMTERYPERDGRKVWLSRDEFAALVDAAETPRRKVALRLAGECGLRSDEVVRVAPSDLFDGGKAGQMLRVPSAKDTNGGVGDRETAIPQGLADLIEALGHGESDEPVVDVTTRSLQNWIRDARSELLEADDRYQYVTMHDLRRSWAGWLSAEDVELGVALRWGGWSDLDTFLSHYRSSATEKAQAKERDKVEWL